MFIKWTARLLSSSSQRKLCEQLTYVLYYFFFELLLEIKHSYFIKIAVSGHPFASHVWASNLTLPVLGLLSFKAQDNWEIMETLSCCIHWKALAEYSQMSTHMSQFQSFFGIFAYFCIGQSSNQRRKAWNNSCLRYRRNDSQSRLLYQTLGIHLFIFCWHADRG